MKTAIEVNNIRLYAYHGCMPEERRIGSDYRVDITVYGDFKKAFISDNLEDAVDYVKINELVEQEMNTPSDLLEHVAYRVAEQIFKELPLVDDIKVKVSKIAPPINGDVETVAAILKVNKKEM